MLVLSDKQFVKNVLKTALVADHACDCSVLFCTLRLDLCQANQASADVLMMARG